MVPVPAAGAPRWRVTRRTLRLVTGLTLLAYIAGHLVNHALGLVSVPLAERGLAVAVKVWHSMPGTVLLYGAVAVHLSLALLALYQRRTLRMPPLELLRIAMGLGIPLVLINHLVFTRFAWTLYDLAPSYMRTVWGLWLADNEARQLAMLVPGWLHGCLGVHFAFGRRAGYRRLQLPLFALALLLPVLGGLGFLAMAKALATDIALRPQLDTLADTAPAAAAGLQSLRDTALALYVGAIALVFGAREVRALVERRRGSLVEITYPQRSIRVPRGWTVLEASRSHHLPHLSMCGGRARCTTCRVRVTAGADHCPPPGADEAAALARIGAAADVRLACQVRPTGNVAVLPLLTSQRGAPAGLAAAPRERDLALVAVTWRNHAEFARRHLPQDAVFAAQAFADSACSVLRAGGAVIVEMRGDHVLAAFGLDGAFAEACRAALAAAGSVERALGGVGERHVRAFGMALDCAVFVHAGRATVAPLGGSGWVVAGDAPSALRALEAAAGEIGGAVSVAALQGAGSSPAPAAVRQFGGVAATITVARGDADVTASVPAAAAS